MDWLNFLKWYVGLHLVVWVYMRWQLQKLLDFQAIPANRERWKYFIREDVYDVKWYNIPRYMTYLPRFVMMWGAIMICAIFSTIVMTIHGLDLPDTTWAIIKVIIMKTGQFELLATGYSRTEKKELKICYKKYLGPDWKPKYSGAPTLISNHTSWCDVCIGVGHFCTCFVCADRIRSIPGVWRVTDLLRCVYVKRVGSDAAASRAKTFEAI